MGYFASIFLGVVLSLSAFSKDVRLNDDLFPVEGSLRDRVDFWKKVYTEIDSEKGYLHDANDLRIIYRVVDHSGRNRRGKIQHLKEEKRAIADTLRSLANKEGRDLSEAEESLSRIVGNRSKQELLRMANDVRHQQGMSDRYLAGLKRSFRYLERIREILKEEGVPTELAFLPHVESSFNYRAYSKVGAAGMWQFMRSTGRIYRLKQNYLIDERRDPEKASRAAARLLRDNYARLQAWPLAITAYNHGPVSIERAVRELGTRSIATIIDRYDGRRFGFASKNFYATYVAASEVSLNYEKYFGKVEGETPFEFSELSLPKSLSIKQISKGTGLSIDTLRDFNLEIRPVAFNAPVFLPAGFQIKVPKKEISEIESWVASLTSIEGGPKDLKAEGDHLVSRGENLYYIAKMYHVSMTDLIMLNEITDPSRLRPGMKLKIPTNEDSKRLLAQKADRPRGAVKVVEPAPAPDTQSVEEPIVVAEEPLPQDEQIVEETPEVSTSRSFSSALEGVYDRILALLSGSEKRGVEEAPEVLANAEPSAATESPASETAVPSFDPENYELGLDPIQPNLYWVVVETDETLGHLADWAGVKTQAIRDANRLKFNQTIQLGQRIRLPLKDGDVPTFQKKRLEYHVALEEDFYLNYRLNDAVDYRVKRGDSVASLTERFQVPFWLIRKYQEKEPLLSLYVGQKIKIPQVEAISSDTTSGPPAGTE